MFKATLLGLHFLTSVLLSGYKGETIAVHNLEETISSSSTQNVELIIVKEAFEGPAKLTIDWSSVKGVEVEEVYSSGASFSFDGKQSLHIWYSIEDDNVVNLNYKVKGKLTDIFQIKGYFSYVKDGEIVKVPLQKHQLAVR